LATRVPIRRHPQKQKRRLVNRTNRRRMHIWAF
jgi:hypothetical protein